MVAAGVIHRIESDDSPVDGVFETAVQDGVYIPDRADTGTLFRERLITPLDTLTT